MSLTSWFLVSSGGTRHRLPREMIFVGRDDCELMLQSRSVDKQHAVLNYDASTDEHLVKDLGSLNGTFVNDVRIPEQTYITLKLEDKLRFGYDTNLFTVVRGEMRVPEEALKHEKFTSQLQLSQKSSETEGSKQTCSKSSESKVTDSTAEVHHKTTEALKSEEKSVDLSAMPRGTPLYGQPAWWGDDEADEKSGCKPDSKHEEKMHETGASGCSTDAKQAEEQSAAASEELYPFCREPSYFEIPTKEFQQPPQVAESTIHEVPTKDTQSSHAAGAGHASFTIEFDDNTPGKVTIKDHVTKFTSEQRHKSKKPSSSSGQDLPGLQTVMMAAESKVADWLAQNNPPRMIWEPTEEDSKSIKSDVPVYLKRLKGNKHDDGTQSDSENAGAHRHYSKRAALEEHLRHHHTELKKSHQKVHSTEKQQEQAVFGVDDSQDYNRPVINENQKDLVKDWAINSATVVLEEKRALSTTGFLDTEEGSTAPGSKRWVSQWASLAANHTRHDQDDSRLESSVPAPLENDTDISESGISIRSAGSAASMTSQGERKRRTLPQLPKEEKVNESSKAKTTSHQRSEIGEKQDTELQEKETPARASDADSRSIAKSSRTMNGLSPKATGDKVFSFPSSSSKEKIETSRETSMVKQALAKIQQERKEQGHWTPTKLSSTKPAANQVEKGREENAVSPKTLDNQDKAPGHVIDKAEMKLVQSEGKRRKNEETIKGQSPKASGGEKKESSKPLVRQGSFTIDKPSTNIPIELIPHINKQSGSAAPLASANRIRDRSDSMDTDSSLDTTLILKDTEAVMAFLEAKLREENKTDEGPETPSYNRDNSISPESDVDTASTISLVTGDTERKSTQKRKSFTTLYKDRCSSGSPSKDVLKSSATSVREKMEKKTKSRSSDGGSRADARKTVQSSGRMRQPSVDLTDDDQTSSVPHSAISDILSSDQETYSSKSHGRVPFASADELLHSKMEGKSAKLKTSPVALGQSSKSTTLPRPRPTRTSLLRRARLGEASDSELADADKASVASEVSTTSSTSKPPSGRRSISRIDFLAQPRRTRLGSLSARSDSEATITRSTASSRTPEAIIRSGTRLTSAGESSKVSARTRANSISRLSDSKSKSLASAHNSPSALKTTRLQSTGTAAQSSNTFKHRIKEQEDYIRDWTAHREEIARISQDLALIAREINDVAGEIDSVTSSGTAPSTTVSTAATTPGSAIDTREEVGDLHGEMHKLVDRVFDESLNFRKIPPVVHTKPPEGNGRPNDARPQLTDALDPPTITRRRTWSRDEVMGDSLLLSSVFQFSRKIRQSIDKTAGKIRILFKDKDRNWEEIESKLRAESEIPIVKTSSMEISSILQELKRVEKQLQAINAMIDPDGTLDALSNLGFASPVLPAQPKVKASPVSQSTRPQVQPNCQPEARALRPAAVPVAAEFENAESESDFSIHFNRFNPDGEEEDATLRE
ncbi:PREDICTED: centrosomal protein of 170 kDa isoform X4 [Tauraco erythrolophus]|uniref:centrosomal protein of 170 kDa isoform X4 n=1 Tax=Tauraco erythrolophus TaxID=121530 RepID=UPI0005234135|nr:PREDICTED: centrosomal protein of 170 kDa isoform X4 [Tauraco erythrolophus]